MQLHSLATISNSGNHNFELDCDFQLACLSMLMLIINPASNFYHYSPG